MKQIKQLLIPLLLGLLLVTGSGCSAIGFGIGALSDSNNIKDLEIPNEQARSISKNSHIQIRLKNGYQLEGQFLSYLEQTTEADYVATILWYDKANNRQVSTELAEIDKILTSQQRNGKWLGLLLGGVIDVVIVIALFKLDRIFDGFSFFNSPHCL